jgi:hypothetical protein
MNSKKENSRKTMCLEGERKKRDGEKLHGKYNTEKRASKKIKKLGVHKM